MPATILVVDDEVSVLNTLVWQLEAEGYNVVTAPNGNEGLKICKSHKPDAVVLDIFMPGMQGKPGCRRTGQRSPNFANPHHFYHRTIEEKGNSPGRFTRRTPFHRQTFQL